MTDELKKIIFSPQISNVFYEHNWIINIDSKNKFHSYFVGEIADYYLNIFNDNDKIYFQFTLEIDIPKRKINVKEIEILSLNKEKAEIKVKVSEGTYIRSLISDIAKDINTFGIVSELKRISIGNIDINHISYINDIKKLDPKTTPNPLSQNEIIDLPILKVNENDLINIKNGELMNNNLFKTKETYILEYDGNVVATYVPFNEKYFKPDKVII